MSLFAYGILQEAQLFIIEPLQKSHQLSEVVKALFSGLITRAEGHFTERFVF